MLATKERYLTDDTGTRVAVVLDLDTYQHMLDELEDLYDIREADAVRAAIAAGEQEVIPLAQLEAELEAHWAAREQSRT